MANDPIGADGQTPLERVPTGIPGLDTVLRGGFLNASIYIVRGKPGAGKTIFGNQFCFNHVAAGHRAVSVQITDVSGVAGLIQTNSRSFKSRYPKLSVPLRHKTMLILPDKSGANQSHRARSLHSQSLHKAA